MATLTSLTHYSEKRVSYINVNIIIYLVTCKHIWLAEYRFHLYLLCHIVLYYTQDTVIWYILTDCCYMPVYQSNLCCITV